MRILCLSRQSVFDKYLAPQDDPYSHVLETIIHIDGELYGANELIQLVNMLLEDHLPSILMLGKSKYHVATSLRKRETFESKTRTKVIPILAYGTS